MTHSSDTIDEDADANTSPSNKSIDRRAVYTALRDVADDYYDDDTARPIVRVTTTAGNTYTAAVRDAGIDTGELSRDSDRTNVRILLDLPETITITAADTDIGGTGTADDNGDGDAGVVEERTGVITSERTDENEYGTPLLRVHVRAVPATQPDTVNPVLGVVADIERVGPLNRRARTMDGVVMPLCVYDAAPAPIIAWYDTVLCHAVCPACFGRKIVLGDQATNGDYLQYSIDLRDAERVRGACPKCTAEDVAVCVDSGLDAVVERCHDCDHEWVLWDRDVYRRLNDPEGTEAGK